MRNTSFLTNFGEENSFVDLFFLVIVSICAGKNNMTKWLVQRPCPHLRESFKMLRCILQNGIANSYCRNIPSGRNLVLVYRSGCWWEPVLLSSSDLYICIKSGLLLHDKILQLQVMQLHSPESRIGGVIFMRKMQIRLGSGRYMIDMSVNIQCYTVFFSLPV